MKAWNWGFGAPEPGRNLADDVEVEVVLAAHRGEIAGKIRVGRWRSVHERLSPNALEIPVGSEDLCRSMRVGDRLFKTKARAWRPVLRLGIARSCN